MRAACVLLAVGAHAQPSPPPPFPPQSYGALTRGLDDRGYPTRLCFDSNGSYVTTTGVEWIGTLAEAQQRCSTTPRCTLVYDWACDGVGWRYCHWVLSGPFAGESEASFNARANSCG